MGIAMGATAVLIIRSPMGKRSGAHFNPAITLTYFRLGKIDIVGRFFLRCIRNFSVESLVWPFRHSSWARVLPIPPSITPLLFLGDMELQRLSSRSYFMATVLMGSFFGCRTGHPWQAQ